MAGDHARSSMAASAARVSKSQVSAWNQRIAKNLKPVLAAARSLGQKTVHTRLNANATKAQTHSGIPRKVFIGRFDDTRKKSGAQVFSSARPVLRYCRCRCPDRLASIFPGEIQPSVSDQASEHKTGMLKFLAKLAQIAAPAVSPVGMDS